jgi:hypothetical protein
VVKNSKSFDRFLAVPAAGLLFLGLLFGLILHGEIWFALSPVDASRQIYANTLFPETLGLGNYLKTNMPPGTTIAVLGSEPEIYFYARRHSATGYIYMYPLKETHGYAGTMQEKMIREIEAARPLYVVSVNLNESWLPQPGSKSILENWWARYGADNYDLVRTIEIKKGRPGETENQDSASPENLMLLKRRSPTEPVKAP